MSTTRIRIRGYHEDRFGHVNNARYLELLEEARWNDFEQRGIDSAVLRELGIFPVVIRLAITYRRPASTGDVLELTTRVAEGGRRKVTLHQEARFAPSGDLCIEAEVTAVFLDEATGRPVTLNDRLLAAWPELRAPAD